MEPTVQNRDFMFDGPQTAVKPFMYRVFEKLRRSDVNTEFANEYVHALRTQWSREGIMLNGQGFTGLQRTCFECGVVETLLQFCQNSRSTGDLAISTYLAMDTFQHLVRTANLPQRRKLYDEMIRHNALEIAIDKVEHHELCLHRYTGRALIRILAQSLFLGESFSARRTADLFEKLCKWTLEGPERDSDELLQPDKTWQSQMMVGRFGTPPRAAAKYAKRWYAMSQEFCMFSVYGMLCRSPPPDAKFIFGVLEFKPELVDMLLKIGSLPRVPWYPDSQIDSLAFESLNRMVLFPLSGVPGLPLEGELKEQYQRACSDVIKSIEIVTSRPNWSTCLVTAWEKLENETPATIKRTLGKVGSDYFAVRPPGDESLPVIFTYRGQIRVSILRLIAASTYASRTKDSDLLSLLRIAYLGSQKYKSQFEASRSGNPEDKYIWTERNEEIARIPFWAIETRSDVDYVAWTPREFITGPIALVRLLSQLATRGIVDRSRLMEELPEGVASSTTLKQVKQILSPDVILKIISLSKKRLTAVREEGRECVTGKKDFKRAHLLYLSASELAWSLLELNQSLNERFATELEGVTKELVLSLGNAAEMCLRRTDYTRAIIAALGVDWVLRHTAPGEDIPNDIIEKNQRRLAHAKHNLRG